MITISPKHTFTYDGATLTIYHANKGEGLAKHQHIYSHAIICHSGCCKVSLEGRSYMMDKNHTPLNLPAGQWHEIEAIEDETVFVNVFAEGKY